MSNTLVVEILVLDCTWSRDAGKRQGTTALQDAGAFFGTLVLTQDYGELESSAVFTLLNSAGKQWFPQGVWRCRVYVGW